LYFVSKLPPLPLSMLVLGITWYRKSYILL